MQTGMERKSVYLESFIQQLEKGEKGYWGMKRFCNILYIDTGTTSQVGHVIIALLSEERKELSHTNRNRLTSFAHSHPNPRL